MRKTYCDHCGREVRNFEVMVEIRFGEIHLEKHDICKACLGDFSDALKNYFSANPKTIPEG